MKKGNTELKIGLILISFVLPAVITPLVNGLCRKAGWVKDGDMKL